MIFGFANPSLSFLIQFKKSQKEKKWLFDPKNTDVIQHLKKALQDPATIDFDEFMFQ